MTSINYTDHAAAADQTTDSDCACHCCGAVLTVAEARDDDSWEDGDCYCAACREADEE